MSKCKVCGKKIKKYEDYSCIRVRIPYLNIKLWGFNYVHSRCGIVSYDGVIENEE